MRAFSLRHAANKLVNVFEQRLQRTCLRAKPLVVDVVLTKACNLACTFCKDYEWEGAKRIDRESMERVARQLFPTAQRLNICSGGEPYLHRGLEDLLRMARRYGTDTWVLSNGMLLEEERMRQIVREGLIRQHGFSVDGIEPKTVEAIRVRAKLPQILDNIDMLLRIRDEELRTEPEITIRYALMRRNIDELPRAIDYWGARGIQHIDTGYLSLANGIDPNESLFFHQDLLASVFDQARAAASRYPGLKLTLPPLVADEGAKETSPSRCNAAWEFVMIDASGNVLPCYRAFEALSMGQMYGDAGQDFNEIWNSKPYRELRRTVNDDSAEKLYGYCRECEFRRGWGRIEAHLGDATWKATAFGNRLDAEAIDHRRRGFKPLTVLRD